MTCKRPFLSIVSQFISSRSFHMSSSSCNVNIPRGFKFSAVRVGIKETSKSDKLDFSAIVSEKPCKVACVYTQNKFTAAPVIVSKEIEKQAITEDHPIHGIIINSGCANAVTGDEGLSNAWRLVEIASSQFVDPTPSQPCFLNMSTGVIGQQLPIDKMIGSMPKLYENLGAEEHHFKAVARAIMTSDTFPKWHSQKLRVNNVEYNIAGMSKGAGMIHPNMATLLGFVVTDLPLGHKELRSILDYATVRSFNSITVDGDTSTNDTIALLANGLSGDSESNLLRANTPEYLMARDAITNAFIELAKLVVKDGEGATKFITIKVSNYGKFQDDAMKVAKTIATSSLFKTAMFGCDANWGRIACAIGNSEAQCVNLETISIAFHDEDRNSPFPVMLKGVPECVDEERASAILSKPEITVMVDLGLPTESPDVTVWTSDLSYEYVKINAEYRT